MADAPKRDGAKAEDAVSSFRAAQPFIDATWQFVGAVLFGALGGWWADGKFGTRPWLLVAGLFLGLGAGFTSFMRVVLAQDKRDKAKRAAKIGSGSPGRLARKPRASRPRRARG